MPNPNAKTEITNIKDTTENLTLTAAANKDIKPEYYYHKPYEEEKCKSCHAEGFSNALIKPVPELCYGCHGDFREKFKTLHGPVASAHCLECHDQHQAKNAKLLTRLDREVCFHCHVPKQVLESKIHEKIGDKNCIECHSPHGGDNRGMLKAGTCNECHQSFSNKYTMLHGPVASGNCTACHDSHSSTSPKKLLRESQELCLSCHNKEQVLSNAAHKKIKNSNCTDCHNPHGEENRYFLLQAFAPPKAKENIKIDSTNKVIQIDNVAKDTIR